MQRVCGGARESSLRHCADEIDRKGRERKATEARREGMGDGGEKPEPIPNWVGGKRW